MPLSAFLTHTSRDDRHRARIAVGTRAEMQRADVSYVGASSVVHGACVKPRGLSIPNGVVAVATCRVGPCCHPVLIEAFEGDAAGFAAFSRLALMLGATELHLITRGHEA